MRPTLALLLVAVAACGGDGANGGGDAIGADTDAADTVADSVGDTAAADTAADADTGAPGRSDLAWDPAKDGPYRVGHRVIAARWDTGGLEPGGEREIALAIWYPTEDTSGPPTAYLDGAIADATVFRGATLAGPVGDLFPLLVYSHEHGGYAGDSLALMKRFASHGWVVAAPDHVGDRRGDGPRGTADYVVRGGDLAAALDALAALPAEDPLAGLVDTQRVVAAGVGFGANAALAVGGASYDLARIGFSCVDDGGPGGDGCSEAALAAFGRGARDARVAGVVLMGTTDLALYAGAGVGDLDVPSLVMTAKEDAVAPDDGGGDLLWLEVPGPAVRVSIDKACHDVFLGGGCARILDAEGQRVVTTYALAWARRELLGDEGVAGVLAGHDVVSGLAAVSVKGVPRFPYAERLAACLGASVPMRVERGLPFGEVAIGAARGWFLLDYATTASTIDPEGFVGGTPEPVQGTENLWADFTWFGGWAPVVLSPFPHRMVGGVHEAGILGTDFLALNVYALDYGGGQVFRADGAGCDELTLRGAGLAPLTVEGRFSSDPSSLPGFRPNVPAVPIAIGGARAVAQLDTGFEDGVVPHAVNVNQALFDAIEAAGVALERDFEKDVLLTTCVTGVAEPAFAFRLPEGVSVELVGEDGAAVASWADAEIYLKQTPASATVCGGIGTWEEPGAQIGASLLGEGGFLLLDPFRARVWWPATPAENVVNP